MVKLHVKRKDESQFLYDTSVTSTVDDVIIDVTAIYNGRLKVTRVCSELEELAQHGTLLPPNMAGLADEQVCELRLVDEWGEKCVPSGGWTFHKDPLGRRNGRQPGEKMRDVVDKTVAEARAIVSKKQIQADVCLTQRAVQSALDILRGAVMIMYPMGLPPHETIRLELENSEDLTGTQASLEVLDAALAQLWFSGRELQRGKLIGDYVGRNEKTKVVVKLQSRGQGPPAREPLLCEEEQKQLMLHAYRRQEQLKKLDQDNDDSYLDSAWADSSSLKKSFQGLSNISWRPK
ncbi:cilia- and flagella-associated protein 298-A [Bacillus rossius redtenbacheri]|uniref:cilia- and flagella-associated protein 298-A n=1 Tax=Bacillus rossius redtenbacheri TaxID=93214 RepID=UPI002FDE93E0